jgi:hypothetical protein
LSTARLGVADTPRACDMKEGKISAKSFFVIIFAFVLTIGAAA